jgi:hypothetical protein
MNCDNPRTATDEALARTFGDIADELARRGADAWLHAFKATSDDALGSLLEHLTHLAEVVASMPAAEAQVG